MSEIRNQFEAMHAAWPDQKFIKFMLENGRDYEYGPASFAGPRGEPKQCFMNATHLALNDPALTYVEGKVGLIIPIDHAWCIDADGMVVDPTLAPAVADGSFDRVSGYFGVPFRTEYLRKAIFRNNNYGLLDIMSAPKTLPTLIDLGLEEGQAWLIRGGRRRRKAVR